MNQMKMKLLVRKIKQIELIPTTYGASMSNGSNEKSSAIK